MQQIYEKCNSFKSLNNLDKDSQKYIIYIFSFICGLFMHHRVEMKSFGSVH